MIRLSLLCKSPVPIWMLQGSAVLFVGGLGSGLVLGTYRTVALHLWLERGFACKCVRASLCVYVRRYSLSMHVCVHTQKIIYIYIYIYTYTYTYTHIYIYTYYTYVYVSACKCDPWKACARVHMK